jgi:arsenate reductase (thioredoxin)
VTTHVLVLCTHNSARSVLAEAMLNHWATKLGKDVRAFSAGSAPSGRINAHALEALGNAGIDTAGCRSKSWDEFSGAEAVPMRVVVTVCDAARPRPARSGRAAPSRFTGATPTLLASHRSAAPPRSS